MKSHLLSMSTGSSLIHYNFDFPALSPCTFCTANPQQPPPPSPRCASCVRTLSGTPVRCLCVSLKALLKCDYFHKATFFFQPQESLPLLLWHPTPTALVALGTFSLVLLLYVELVFLAAVEKAGCLGPSPGFLRPHHLCVPHRRCFLPWRHVMHQNCSLQDDPGLHYSVLQPYLLNTWASVLLLQVHLVGFADVCIIGHGPKTIILLTLCFITGSLRCCLIQWCFPEQQGFANIKTVSGYSLRKVLFGCWEEAELRGKHLPIS